MSYDVKEIVKKFTPKFNVMQLATSESDTPWICTVHFYMDEDFNFYWVSRTDRRHSQEIAKNPNASITIVVHENTPDENYVISITASGKAEALSDVPEKIREAYITKLNKPTSSLPDRDDPNNLQGFYRLRPGKITLFDTKNFPKEPKQEVSVH